MACEFYYKSPRCASFGCGVKFQYLQSGHLHSGRLLPSSLLLPLSCTPHKGFYAILKNFYGSTVPGYLDSITCCQYLPAVDFVSVSRSSAHSCVSCFVK